MARFTAARFAAVLGLIVVAVGVTHWWEPLLTQKRTVVTSSPSPGAIGPPSNVSLRAGARVCVAPATIDRTTARGEMLMSSRRPATVTLELQVTGPGYRTQRQLVERLRPQVRAVALPVPSPPRSVAASFCVRNAGPSAIELAGTADGRFMGVSRTSIDGRPLEAQTVELSLYEAKARSNLERLGTIVHRASDFTGNTIPFWLAWVLVVGLVIGTPLAIFGALWSTLRAE